MYWNTVTPLLREILEAAMTEPLFYPFRLVGGTALSLQRGHRSSVDIDLFTDAAYDSIDFAALDQWLRSRYPVVSTHHAGTIGFGISYYVGYHEKELVKVDLYYTDVFMYPALIEEGIRMADEKDIIAMKMVMIGQGARKKDFWDLHELSDDYPVSEMIAIYQAREPHGYSSQELQDGFINFSNADDDFDPVCLHGKHWEMIKYDLVQWGAK